MKTKNHHSVSVFYRSPSQENPILLQKTESFAMANQSLHDNLFLSNETETAHERWLRQQSRGLPLSLKLLIITLQVKESLYFLGCITNIPVLVTFYKNSLASTSNMSFFVLAAVDLFICFLLMPQAIHRWTSSLCYKSQLCRELYNFYSKALLYPVKESFKSFGAFITVVITVERLCSILFPMKVS